MNAESSLTRCGPSLLLLLWGCGNVDDVAGTWMDDRDATFVDAGLAALQTDASPDQQTAEAAPETPLCDGQSQWLAYTLTTHLTAPLLTLDEDLLQTQELLFVDAACTYWVEQAGTGEVRTGVLDAAQAAKLWGDLGPTGRAGVEQEQGTVGSPMVRTVQDNAGLVTCLGDCTEPEVGSRAEQVFSLASEWTALLYQQGGAYDGGVVVAGVPVTILDVPLTAVPWPLQMSLSEFFASNGTVRVEGQDANLLRELKQQALELGPVVGELIIAEDAVGDRYALLVQEAVPPLP